MAGGRFRSFVRGAEPFIRTRRSIVSRTVYLVVYIYMARRPRGSYLVYPLLSLDVPTPESKSVHSTLSSICEKVRLTSGS